MPLSQQLLPPFAASEQPTNRPPQLVPTLRQVSRSTQNDLRGRVASQTEADRDLAWAGRGWPGPRSNPTDSRSSTQLSPRTHGPVRELGRLGPVDRTLIKDLSNEIGKTVRVTGWVDTLRLQRKMQFVVLRDHSGHVQLTNERSDDETTTRIDQLKSESAVDIIGKVVAADQVKLGGIEILVDRFLTASISEQPLPVDETSSVDLRGTYRYLDLRRLESQAVFRLGTLVEDGMRSFARAEGCVELHSPKLMGSASEGGSEVFEVSYFDRKAYLAQSPQFYKQMAIASGLDRVFEIGPVFRAEPSFTTRHSTEFTGVDVELAWIQSLDEVMTFEEGMIASAITHATSGTDSLWEMIPIAPPKVPTFPFPRRTHYEAIALLRDTGWESTNLSAPDLDPDGERRLSQLILEETGSEFVFVTEYPLSLRPFYHMTDDESPLTTKSFDLLWRGLEITTGAQREHRHDVLLKQLSDKHIDGGQITYYTDMFRYGVPPHGGFGLGLSRFLMAMLGLQSIREATFLFRGPNRLFP